MTTPLLSMGCEPAHVRAVNLGPSLANLGRDALLWLRTTLVITIAHTVMVPPEILGFSVVEDEQLILQLMFLRQMEKFGQAWWESDMFSQVVASFGTAGVDCFSSCRA